MGPLSELFRVRRDDLQLGNLDNIFLLFAQFLFAARKSALCRGSDVGEMSPSPPLWAGLSFSVRLGTHILAWLKTNDAHKHTHRRESMLLSRTLFVFRVHNACSFPLSLHIALLLASSSSPLPSKQPSVACQCLKLLALSGL